MIIASVSLVEQHEHREEVASRIYALVREHKPDALVIPLRELASEELERGYPRAALLDNFESVRGLLESQDRNDEEDAVITVMDALIGWCSPGAKL